MKKDLDVAALGEVLIDFTTAGTSGQNHMLFEANPGGAPCNVLAMLRKLDKHVALHRQSRERMKGYPNTIRGQYSFTPDRIFQEIPKHIFPDFADKCNVFIQFS